VGFALDFSSDWHLGLQQVAYLAVEGSVYAFLSTSAAPVYDAQGGLVSGGTDLASPVR